jgi:hypothetical protein
MTLFYVIEIMLAAIVDVIESAIQYTTDRTILLHYVRSCLNSLRKRTAKYNLVALNSEHDSTYEEFYILGHNTVESYLHGVHPVVCHNNKKVFIHRQHNQYFTRIFLLLLHVSVS